MIYERYKRWKKGRIDINIAVVVVYIYIYIIIEDITINNYIIF